MHWMQFYAYFFMEAQKAKLIPWDWRSADGRPNRVEWSEVSGVVCWNQNRDVYVGEILLKNGGAGWKTAGQETSSHLITRAFFVFFYFPEALSRNTGRERVAGTGEGGWKKTVRGRRSRDGGGPGGNYATAVPG